MLENEMYKEALAGNRKQINLIPYKKEKIDSKRKALIQKMKTRKKWGCDDVYVFVCKYACV